MLEILKVYIDTSVIISLADPLDIFHDQSITSVDNLIKHRIECNVSSPLAVELGRIVKVKGIKRCLDITDSLEEFKIDFRSTDMKEVWKLSQTYLDGQVLTVRHRLDLFHYAAASLLDSTHLASWNSRQFNDKIAMKVSRINSKQGLLSLIAGKPDYIVRRANLD